MKKTSCRSIYTFTRCEHLQTNRVCCYYRMQIHLHDRKQKSKQLQGSVCLWGKEGASTMPVMFYCWKESEASKVDNRWCCVQGCSLCLFEVFTSSYFLIKWKTRRGREEERKQSRQEWKKGQECKLAWLHIWSERCLSSLNKTDPRKHALKLGHKNEVWEPRACTYYELWPPANTWQRQAKLAN